MSDLSGAWFTASRLDRLLAILQLIPSRRTVEKLPRATVHLLLFPSVGGSIEEIHECIRVLELLRLTVGDDFIRRTVDGDRVVRALKNGDPSALPLTILRSGCLSEQIQ